MKRASIAGILCLPLLFGLGCWAGAGAVAPIRPVPSEDVLCTPLIAALRTDKTRAIAAWHQRQQLAAIETVSGMPPVPDADNLYSETGADHLSKEVEGALSRVYVPNRQSDSVSVIDPATYEVVDRFPVGRSPQHVVPSWDLKTLWVANNGIRGHDGSLTPIDPKTAKPGPAIPVDDPYNLYFSPDGSTAIVVAEELKRLEFRDPHTMNPEQTLDTPECDGINHADFAIDGRYAIFTCEFNGGLLKVDMVNRQVLGYLKLPFDSMPQDIRVSPEGWIFYVADMHADGVFMIDGDNFRELGFIATGIGTHGLYPSRDAKWLYVANRGSHRVIAPPHGRGSVSVIDFEIYKKETETDVAETWPIHDGGSPDMGNVSADGKTLWLSGRFDNVVYAIDTASGQMRTIPVGIEPHGLAVWPQPGRYSLGHTGNMR